MRVNWRAPHELNAMDMGRRQSTIELVAIDMDGTLLDPSHQLTSRARKAIAQARALGVHIVLTSGRRFRAWRRTCTSWASPATTTTASPAMAAGAAHRHARNRGRISAQLRRLPVLRAGARGLGVHFQALDSRRMYTPNQDISYYTVADSHLSRMPLSYRRVEDMDPSMSFIKLMMIDEPEVLDAAIARLPSELTERFAVLKSAPFFLEVFDRRAGKGPSLQKLAEHLGIDRAHVMAIGDQENDLTMLQYAGTSVAMGNAIDAVKAVARFETTSNADDGVARAIERFVLQ